MSESKTPEKKSIQMSPTDYNILEYIYKNSIQANIPPEVFVQCFEISHEDRETFDEYGLIAAIGANLMLDNTVKQYYKLQPK